MVYQVLGLMMIFMLQSIHKLGRIISSIHTKGVVIVVLILNEPSTEIILFYDRTPERKFNLCQ